MGCWADLEAIQTEVGLSSRFTDCRTDKEKWAEAYEWEGTEEGAEFWKSDFEQEWYWNGYRHFKVPALFQFKGFLPPDFVSFGECCHGKFLGYACSGCGGLAVD